MFIIKNARETKGAETSECIHGWFDNLRSETTSSPMGASQVGRACEESKDGIQGEEVHEFGQLEKDNRKAKFLPDTRRKYTNGQHRICQVPGNMVR